jgi:16S rRNA U516 pseudouridylate synthase RsuA-like enzyme
MVGRVGNEVVRLVRTRFAGVLLSDLPEGHWRHLKAEEVAALVAPVQPRGPAEPQARSRT